MDKKLSEEALLEWYADQYPRTVDIVGDFAGRELFAIQAEALMRYCLSEAKVDFDGMSCTPLKAFGPGLISHLQEVSSCCTPFMPSRNSSATSRRVTAASTFACGT